MATPPRVAARAQLLAYAGGTALLSIGLAWAGWLGAPRKTPAGLMEATAGMPALGVAALGGLVAIVAVVAFVWLAGRRLLALRVAPAPSYSRRELRLRALALTLGAVLVVGALISVLPRSGDEAGNLTRHAEEKRREEIDIRFQQGVAMLQAKQFEHALTAFHRVLALAPAIPEAHANMGFALLGLERYKEAADFFDSATTLRRDQLNAYYGLALALEGMGDLRGAIEAMRTYVHRAPQDDPYVRKANAALWEWQAQLRPVTP
jgi:tetratricopeptide (TPR) repeat protein